MYVCSVITLLLSFARWHDHTLLTLCRVCRIYFATYQSSQWMGDCMCVRICVLYQLFAVDAECISTLVSFERLYALCQNARASSVRVPVISVTGPAAGPVNTVPAAERSDTASAGCCCCCSDSAALRKLVKKSTVLSARNLQGFSGLDPVRKVYKPLHDIQKRYRDRFNAVS